MPMRSPNAILVCCALCLACGSSTTPGPSDAGGDGSGGDAGTVDASDGPRTCVQVNIPIVPPPPPDVLIVLDQSASMNDDINGQSCAGGCGASSKWSLLSAAIENLVMTNQTSINFGLKLFPNDSSCGVNDGATVQVGPSTTSAIQYALTAAPDGEAPIESAIGSAVSYLQELNDSSPKLILLATGGQPSCAPGGDPTADDSAGAETAVSSALTAGRPTFVLGVASSSDPVATATLNQMATNGGEAQTGAATSYFALSDLDALSASLNKMFSTGGCTLPLSGGSAGGALSVSVTKGNGTFELPQDPINGWSYDASTQNIVLNGSACADFLDYDDTNITLSSNCGG